MSTHVIHVPDFEPREKHPRIFDAFDTMPEGDTLQIVNDHDPKPLYYQMIGERGNIFNWTYLKEGPEEWIVDIYKRTSEDSEDTIAELVGNDFRKVEVFKKFGLDFCCGGKQTVKEACDAKGIDATQVNQELKKIENTAKDTDHNFNDWELDALVDHIVTTHHAYVNKMLPELGFYSNKVATVHSDEHPELITVHQLVQALTTELQAHMAKEERILFPYVKELVQNNAAESNFSPSIGSVKAPINIMEMEHEMAGETLAKIRSLTQEYTLPDDACASYKLLFNMLEDFEKDLHIHIHLENNILFPKAIAIENSLSVA